MPGPNFEGPAATTDSPPSSPSLISRQAPKRAPVVTLR